MSIIKSLLDTDLYKFTTSYAYAKLFPRAMGEFVFIDRDKVQYPEGFDLLVKDELQAMAKIALTDEEAAFLEREMPYIPPIYIDFLRGYRFDPNEVKVSLDENRRLQISAEGLLYRITLWETPILALVSELYYRVTQQKPDIEYTKRVIVEKAEKMKAHNVVFSMFGMRRRFSLEIEDLVTKLLKEHSGTNFFGTSNMYLAMKHGLKVSGTHPHEWIQFHGAIYGYKMANYMAMEHWIDVYDGDLGTVLTDTYTTDVFMKNFSKKHAMLFTSLRHDSGDPILFIDKAIKRYIELRVDPKIKYLIFSDSLNVDKAIRIKEACEGKIRASFGIGTNFSNDVGNNVKPMNIVMKLWKCKMTKKETWHNCVKLSDVIGKHTGDPQELALAMQTLDISQKI